ncbi:MAG: ParB/RepB/Spo0J family partition protein [Salinispira sp.]
MARQALGRGLNSLMPKVRENEGIVHELPVSVLIPNPEQPRKQFQEEQLKELAQSIREQGIIQPLIVDKHNDEKYIIIAGERRYRAALHIGLKQVPVIVKNLSESSRLEIGLIENVQREDLSAIEEALAYRTLIDSFHYTQEDIAEKIGKSRSAIANTLRLLRLPENIRNGILGGEISAGHARALLTVEQESAIQDLYRQIIDNNLSVRAAEELVRNVNSGADVSAKPDSTAGNRQDSSQGSGQKSLELNEMEEMLIKTLGTRVEIRGSDKKGKIIISYYNSDDLNRLHDLFAND